MPYTYEYTDTFGGEANYCWVKRGDLTAVTQKGAIREARATCGLQNMRGKIETWGDDYVFRPAGFNTILFVSWVENPSDESEE